MCILVIAFKILKWFIKCLFRCLCICCPPVWLAWECVKSINWLRYIGFLGGYVLGQMYYDHFLKQIPFPYDVGPGLGITISMLLGFGNAVCRQLRCISLLVFPMYCGKPGRGVLKAVVLTYVIAGPITNMGYNAKEVVRVFACSTQLSYNLSLHKHALMAKPFKTAIYNLKDEVIDVKYTLGSFREVAQPIEKEILDEGELNMSRNVNNFVDDLFMFRRRSDYIEKKYEPNPNQSIPEMYQKNYLKKMEYRCNDQISKAIEMCVDVFRGAFASCCDAMPRYAAWALCWPMRITYLCNLMHIIGGNHVCDSSKIVNPGLGEGFLYLEKAKNEISQDFRDVRLQYRIDKLQEVYDVQDARETGERVMHAFEEKHIIMHKVVDAVNLCVALLFLRIIVAAASYHESYLTSIGHDNVYITGYFKKIDKRRKKAHQFTLLPLKKMERSKYIDVHSWAYMAERNKIVTQILKVMLEMITATTFVMLDRLFYEALDVVRQHAEADIALQGEHDLDILVDGTGLFARVVRSILSEVSARERIRLVVSNRPCLPRPRCMSTSYYVYIYGGYLWILLLLYFNPYTLRLRRLICSWFYPKREKQRILHLYNDILKKRVKMHKTLHKKAVQAIRAHYLSGENLLSLRMKFPQLLGWLRMFPAARMTCLICGETEPRSSNGWHSCISPDCEFLYCDECWHDVGEQCFACDPSLPELSDVESLSEDEQLRY